MGQTDKTRVEKILNIQQVLAAERRTFNCQVVRQLGMSSDLSSHAPFVTDRHTTFFSTIKPYAQGEGERKKGSAWRGRTRYAHYFFFSTFSLNIITYLLFSYDVGTYSLW